VIHPLISFVLSWTQSVIKHNTMMKQLHPKHLTQWSIAQYYFWKGGQATFPEYSSSPHSTYSWWVQSDCHGGKSMSLMSVCSDSYSWTSRESWRDGFVGTGLIQWDKTFLQRTPLCFANCTYTEGCPGDFLSFYMMEHSRPFMGDPASSVNRNKTTACGGRHILWVVTLSHGL
jgi:hypothetical protein